MIPFGLTSLMTVSLPVGRRTTKCLVPGASAIYLMNEGSGTTLTDYSGNAYDGTFGATTAAPTWATEGITLDGGDHVAITPAIPALQGLTACTVQIVAWVTSSVSAAGILGPADTSAVNKTIIFCYDANDGAIPANVVRMGVADGANGFSVSVPGKLTAAPTLLTMRFIGGSVIEGRENLGAWTQNTTSPIAALNASVATPSLLLGKRSTTGITGGLAAALFYPIALTDTQIAQNYAALQGILSPRGITLP